MLVQKRTGISGSYGERNSKPRFHRTDAPGGLGLRNDLLWRVLAFEDWDNMVRGSPLGGNAMLLPLLFDYFVLGRWTYHRLSSVLRRVVKPLGLLHFRRIELNCQLR